MTAPKLNVYTDEEVDMFVTQGGTAVDRLLLHGINNLAAVLIAHVTVEEEVQAAQGTTKEIKARAEWVDTQIDKQRARTEMMKKVTESGAIWAAIALLGMLAIYLKESAVAWLHTLGAGK